MADRATRLPVLPVRAREAHKGDFGHALIMAGSPGMTGAGCLAALAAQRAGAGLVTLAVPESLNAIVEAKLTSAMSLPLPEPGMPVLGLDAARLILDMAQRFRAVAVGPGLGRVAETREAVRLLVRWLGCPAVIDADGLNALADDLEPLDKAPASRILTPHPGEMARLLGTGDTRRVQRDREGTAARFAREHGVVLALKGAGTVVTDGERVFVNPTGNPGMATGGTGDVLTGLTAGLLCQGLEPFEALQLAVFVHGLAGDMAARDVGELSMTAEDLLERVPEAFLAATNAKGDPAAAMAAV